MKKELNLNCYKTVGFYFSVVSMILLILSMVLYKTKFTGILSEYYNNVVFIPAIIGLVLSVILLIFNKTSIKNSKFVKTYVFLSEYCKNYYAYDLYETSIKERAKMIIENNALQKLSKI